MCFFVHILPKLYYFWSIPSSLLLAFLHPAAGSFLLPAQPCFPPLAPLLTPALLLSLLVLVSSCVSVPVNPAPGSVTLVHRGTCLTSSSISVSPWGPLFTFLGSCLSLFLEIVSSVPVCLVHHVTPFRAFCWGTTSFTTAHQILDSPLVHSFQHSHLSQLLSCGSVYPLVFMQAVEPLNAFSLQLQPPDCISGLSQSLCLSLRLSVQLYFSCLFLQHAGSGVCPLCIQIIWLFPLPS